VAVSRYVDPRGKVFAHLDRLVDWERGRKVAPVTLEWDLSNRCTLGCQDCHMAYTHQRGPWATSPRALPMLQDRGGDLADTALVQRALIEAKDAGVQGIVWSGGGEPTTHPDWLQIVSYASAHGLQQGMYTLGGLISEQQAAIAKNALTWVVVSLDAADPHVYHLTKRVPRDRYERACEGIYYLTGGSAVVGVSFLLHQDNWRDAPVMLATARALKADYATFRPAIRFDASRPSLPLGDRDWVTKALPLLEALSKEQDVEVDPQRFLQWRDWTGHGYTTCTGVRLSAVVTPDGRVWVCTERRERQDSLLGDLRTESFTTLWARHPGHHVVDKECRVMCRLHRVNQMLTAMETPPVHGAFL
jgi:MoaA/NifB/PqqE/SkfB family radical SAM enzyme